MSSHVEIRTDNRLTNAAPDAVATPDEPVRWAVMDSGIHEALLDDHPWFETATVGKRYDATGAGTGCDAIGHGSACASIIAKTTPSVELWSVRIFGENGRTTPGAITDAYDWLIDHADQLDGVNMSWGARSDDPEINAKHEQLVSMGCTTSSPPGTPAKRAGVPRHPPGRSRWVPSPRTAS